MKKTFVMRLMAVFIFSLFAFSLMLCGCAKEKPAPEIPKGRCRMNSDCPVGYRCNVNQFCEDIYHPKLPSSQLLGQ